MLGSSVLKACAGNERLQEMMQIMVKERGGIMYGMDDRYCIDNGAMIAHTGLVMYMAGHKMPFEESFCTQRYVFSQCLYESLTISVCVQVPHRRSRY